MKSETQSLSSFVRSSQERADSSLDSLPKPPEPIEALPLRKRRPAPAGPRTPLPEDPDGAKRLGKSVLAAAVLQTAGMFAMHEAGSWEVKQQAERGASAERAEERRAFYEQGRARSERLDRTIGRLERIQRERKELVMRARAELKEGRFDLGEFFLTTNRLDALEDENRELDTERARTELHRLVTRFNERMEALGRVYDAEHILQALEYAVSEYDYYGVDGLLLTDSLNERAAECSMESDLLTAILWKAGVRSVGIRVYSPGAGQRFAHRSPILLVQDGHRQREVDLISGGQPFRDRHGRTQGILLHATELVEAYAKYNHIPDPEHPERAASGNINSGSSDTSVDAPPAAVGSDVRGEHFAFPVPPPTESTAFPDISPAASGGIMHVYRSERGRISVRRVEQEGTPEYDTDCLARAATSSLPFVRREHPIASRQGPVEVDTSFSASNIDFESVSGNIDNVDALLQREELPARRAIITGVSAAMWEQMYAGWVEQQKPRLAQHAFHMAEARRRELHALLSNLNAQDFVQAIGLDRYIRYPDHETDYQRVLSVITLDHAQGWPLLYELVRKAFESPRELYRGRIPSLEQFGADLLETMSTREEYAQVWQLMSRFSLDARWFIYIKVELEGRTLLGTGMEIERELLLAQEVLDQRGANERATGVIRVSNRLKRYPFIYDVSTPIVARHDPLWSSFGDVRQWTEALVHERQVNSRWASLCVFRTLEHLNDQEVGAIDAMEKSRLRTILGQALPWLTASREALHDSGVPFETIDALMNPLQRFAH